jgi:hypothetical protein
MSESVKKRTASNIYFGIDNETGNLLHISEVQSGKRCGCNCAACGAPLEARKGNLRRYHFAHISNYECMYSSEVSIYKALAVIMEQEKRIVTPAVLLSFPSWDNSEELQPSKEITVDNVVFTCEKLAYPPDLFLQVHDSKLRILIDFAHYYDDQDKRLVFEREARESGYSCLMYHMPSVGKEEAFTPDCLRSILRDSMRSEWIFNRVCERWKSKFDAVAEVPPEHGSGFECYLHVGYYKGVYSARYVDCAYCRYNIATPPCCRCTVKAGIQSVKDFSCDTSELKKKTDEIRARNDESRIQAERAAQHRAVSMPRITSYSASQTPSSPRSGPTDAELLAEQMRITATFDPQSPDWTVDCYQRRWIKCRECGQVLRDTEMACYGGPGGANLGICSKCSRKGR